MRCRSAVAGRHLRGDVPARLFARQYVVDGADGGHRVRGRRRHRRAGERDALHRARHATLRGDAEGRARGRFHGPGDESVLDRRLFAHSADGRDYRTLLPGIRCDSSRRHRHFADHFPDDDADALRPSQPAQGGGQAGLAAARGRADFRMGQARLRHVASLGAAQSRHHHVHPAGDGRSEFLSVL